MAASTFTKEAAEYARDNLELITGSMTSERRDATRKIVAVIHRFITVAEEAAPNETPK